MTTKQKKIAASKRAAAKTAFVNSRNAPSQWDREQQLIHGMIVSPIFRIGSKFFGNAK